MLSKPSLAWIARLDWGAYRGQFVFNEWGYLSELAENGPIRKIVVLIE
jgi:hypothetical protein